MPRVPGLTWLSAGQLDAMNDEVRSLLNVDQTIVYKMTLTDEVKSLLNVDQTIVSKMMLKVMEAWMGTIHPHRSPSEQQMPGLLASRCGNSGSTARSTHSRLTISSAIAVASDTRARQR